MTTIAERIKTKQAEVKKLKDDLTLATKALDEADAEGEEAALATVDELTDQLSKATKSLDSLQRAEKALAERAETVEEDGGEGADGRTGPPVTKKAPIVGHERGKKSSTPIWVRMATANFIAHVQKRNVDDVIEKLYEGHKDLQAVRMIQKTAVPLATTFTAGWAQELVRNDIQGFLQLLATTSMTAALAGRAMSLTFDGFNSVTIPGRKARGANNNMAGAFVGEGGAIPLGRIDMAAQKLERYKMAVISTFSRELAERSTPSIESVIEQAIREDMSIRLDQVVFGNGAAVPGVQPAGLLFGTTPLTGTAGGGSDALIADIKQLVGALAAAGNAGGIVLFMNDQDALSVGLMQNALGELMFTTTNGQLLNFALVVSENQPKGTLTGVAAPSVATAFDAPDFDVNDVATVVEANADTTAPTHATAAGAATIGTANQVPQKGGIPADVPGTGAAYAGAQARSLWQTYSVGVRSVMPASWGMIRAGAAASVTGITW